MHDTFYVNNKSQVLRTHTSPVQVRTMLESKPPIAVVSPGKVYRKDDDATHLPMFHQIEGLYVDEDVNFAHLKDLIYKICHSLFGEEAQLRFRPSYFPFTEPSAEVDVLFGDKWLEILGCGVVNPKVLDNCGIDSKQYSGLAFGLGIERIAMLKYKVNDIRDFYKSKSGFLEAVQMKIVYSHLLNLLEQQPKLEELSELLFQLGHEHEIDGEVLDMEITTQSRRLFIP